jgi:hypothetical protein
MLVMGHGYDANARAKIDNGLAVCMIDNDCPLYVCKRALLRVLLCVSARAVDTCTYVSMYVCMHAAWLMRGIAVWGGGSSRR